MPDKIKQVSIAGTVYDIEPAQTEELVIDAKNPTLSFGTTTTVGNIGGVDFKVTMPEYTNKISGTVTKEVGGISKNTVYTDADIASVLSDLLFPYVAPTFNGLTLYNSSGTTVSTTHEYGTAITVSKFKPSFTAGSKTINSIKVGTSSGGSDLYSSTSASSGSTYNLTTTKHYDGKTTGDNTIYCTISDGTQSKSGNAKVTFAYYPYAYASSSTSVSSITSGAQKATGTSTSTAFSLTLSADSYVWILLPPGNSGTKTIQYEALGQWYTFDGGTAEPVDVLLKLNSGQTVTYQGYRTKKKAAAGTTSFKLV